MKPPATSTVAPPRALLPPFRLEAYFTRWEFVARHHLTASDSETMTVEDLLRLGGEHARASFDRLALGYLETAGSPALREAVAATYDALEPEDVLVCAGADEALFWTIRLVAGPGDHVLVTVPNYQAVETAALASGAEVTGVPLDEGDRWRLDLDAVGAALRPTTRLLAVNFPNNPTGAVPDEATWRRLAQLCHQRGVRLFSDEIYRGLEPVGAARLPQAADLSPSAISMGGLSKAYGLPGLRIGWLATRDRELLRLVEGHKHYTSLCNAGPSEFLAAVAVRERARIWRRNQDILMRNLPLFEAFFARHADLFEWAPPEGGSVAYPRYLGADGVEAFCRDLIETEGVLLLPASLYASQLAPAPTDRFRIGLGRRDPESALAAMDRFLAGR